MLGTPTARARRFTGGGVHDMTAPVADCAGSGAPEDRHALPPLRQLLGHLRSTARGAVPYGHAPIKGRCWPFWVACATQML